MINSENIPHSFFISNTFISNTRSKLAGVGGNQEKAKQHPETELLLLKIIGFLFPRYHTKIIEDILKTVQITSVPVLMRLYESL